MLHTRWHLHTNAHTHTRTLKDVCTPTVIIYSYTNENTLMQMHKKKQTHTWHTPHGVQAVITNSGNILWWSMKWQQLLSHTHVSALLYQSYVIQWLLMFSIWSHKVWIRLTCTTCKMPQIIVFQSGSLSFPCRKRCLFIYVLNCVCVFFFFQLILERVKKI